MSYEPWSWCGSEESGYGINNTRYYQEMLGLTIREGGGDFWLLTIPVVSPKEVQTIGQNGLLKPNFCALQKIPSFFLKENNEVQPLFAHVTHYFLYNCSIRSNNSPDLNTAGPSW
jgi:hypothetical protein